MSTVVIGCRLPSGLILRHPKRPDIRVKLKGVRDSRIIGATHCTTEVDEDFWRAWHAANKTAAVLRSGAVFEAKTAADADAIVDEIRKDLKTGFDPLSPTAFGVKKDDGKDG